MKKRQNNNQARAYFLEQYDWLLDLFKSSNVVVFGKKGAGKDVLFALVIYLLNDLHYANMRYNDKTLLLKSLLQLSVGGNTYKNLVEGTVKKYADPFIPGLPIFISDGAVYFSSQNNSEVDATFPGLAIFEALSRQLGQHQIHVNTQSLGRLYIKIREQSDAFIKCLNTTDCGQFLLVDAISYDKYKSAEDGMLPFPGDDRKSREYLEYSGRYGEIEYRTFYVNKKWLHFDTHYFSKIFLDGNGVLEALKND